MADESALMAQQAENASAAAKQQSKEQQEVAYYMQLIQQKVQRFLLLPPTSKADMQVLIELELFPDGEVRNARIIESSGSPPFDRAAMEAIRDARSLPVPTNVGTFRRHFSRFNVRIKPAV